MVLWLIFCLVIGVLMAAAAQWVAASIEKKENKSTLMGKLLVFGWVFYLAVVGLVVRVLYVQDKRTVNLEQRIERLENANKVTKVDTVYVKDFYYDFRRENTGRYYGRNED